jgi:SAM-dependent methyltransferase
LIFPNPMPVPKGGIGQHYSMAPSEYFALHDPTETLANCDQLLAEGERIVPVGRLLDIGSGRGEAATAAKRRGWNVTCLEPSPVFAGELRRNGFEVIESTVERFDAHSPFDAVLLSAVLEHLYNPVEVIAAVGRHLRPGGLLYLDVPNEFGLFFRMGNLYNKLRGTGATVNISPTFSPFHVFGYGKHSVIKILAAHKFEIARLTIHTGIVPLSRRKGMQAAIEAAGVAAVQTVSKLTGQGVHIDLWARKVA